MFQSETLQEKWKPLLNHEGCDEIKDPHRRAVTAVLLENQEKFLREESFLVFQQASGDRSTMGILDFTKAFVIQKGRPLFLQLFGLEHLLRLQIGFSLIILNSLFDAIQDAHVSSHRSRVIWGGSFFGKHLFGGLFLNTLTEVRLLQSSQFFTI